MDSVRLLQNKQRVGAPVTHLLIDQFQIFLVIRFEFGLKLGLTIGFWFGIRASFLLFLRNVAAASTGRFFTAQCSSFLILA